LNELESEKLIGFGPLEALLGVVGGTPEQPQGMGMRWMDKVTETIKPGASEIWEIHNFTMDAHPIHLHQTMFRVLNREVLPPPPPMMSPLPPPGPFPPEPLELSYKDTVMALPGQITRIQALFDIPGRYVWHCHIIDHEDNEMMRPYEVAYVYHFPLIGNQK
jgi:FtsP/CotA-like multicopper oxidase with cupredoxin domain